MNAELEADPVGAERPSGQLHTRYEVRRGAAWITLDRPQVRNALSATLVNEVADHLEAAYADPLARVVVITGEGRGFCSGADLKNPPGQAKDGERATTYPELLTSIMEGPKPVIAAINGAAFAGGLGLVGAADIAFAVASAQFSFSEVRIGVIPAIISVVCMPKLGPSRCMRLFLNGERFDAAAAERYGLIHEVVGDGGLELAVEREVDQLALGGPTALAECKRLVRRVSEWSIAEGLEKTPPWSAELFRGEEAQEGIAAFREKRAPSWVSELREAVREESDDE